MNVTFKIFVNNNSILHVKKSKIIINTYCPYYSPNSVCFAYADNVKIFLERNNITPRMGKITKNMTYIKLKIMKSMILLEAVAL